MTTSADVRYNSAMNVTSFEVTRAIRAKPALRDIPVIAVTSHAMSEDNARALEAGCDAYFSKPVSPRTLLDKIREYVP